MTLADRPDASLNLIPTFSETFRAVPVHQGVGLDNDFAVHIVRDKKGEISGLEMRGSRVFRLFFRRVADTVHVP